MVLLLAIVAGLLAGLVWSRWRRQPYRSPQLQHLWLAFVAFLPQFVVVYLPTTRNLIPDWLVAVLLIVSQIMLLVFAWVNRRMIGMLILLGGAALNLAVMTTNSGFMPIGPQTASRLVSEDVLRNFPLGSRFGIKDILLRPEDTRLELLADRFLPPTWFPYQVAFSLGDVFIALGIFWLLSKPQSSVQFTQKGISV
ncbi:hypothetical protein ANAEL_00733 [Anaerolineales bacterium]|nr:hypothetical protein ANAEL_00733 [Anaerolineales bacterium]